jgi:hypothetical protein
MWAALELVTSKSQLFKGIKVYEVDVTAPSMRALVSRVVPTIGLIMRRNLPDLEILFG